MSGPRATRASFSIQNWTNVLTPMGSISKRAAGPCALPEQEPLPQEQVGKDEPVTTLYRTAESEARWNAWLTRGQAHDLRIRRKARFVEMGFALACGIVVAALLFGC